MKVLAALLVTAAFSQTALASTYSFSCKSSDGRMLVSDNKVIIAGPQAVTLDKPDLESGLEPGAKLNYHSQDGQEGTLEIVEMISKGVVSEEDNGPCLDGQAGYTHGQLTEKYRIQGNWLLNKLPAQKVILTCIESHTWGDNCSY